MFTNGLGSNEGGFDTAVADKFGGEGAEKGLALIGGFAEFGNASSVANHGQF